MSYSLGGSTEPHSQSLASIIIVHIEKYLVLIFSLFFCCKLWGLKLHEIDPRLVCEL